MGFGHLAVVGPTLVHNILGTPLSFQGINQYILECNFFPGQHLLRSSLANIIHSDINFVGM